MKSLFYLELKKYTFRKVNYIYLIIMLIVFVITVPVKDLHLKHNLMVDVMLSQSLFVSALYCNILSHSYSTDYHLAPYYIISNNDSLTKKMVMIKILSNWLVTTAIGMSVFLVDILRLMVQISFTDIKLKILGSNIYNLNLDDSNILLNILLWIVFICFFSLGYTLILLTISSFTNRFTYAYIIGFIVVNYLYFMDFLSPFLPKFLYLISPFYGTNFMNLNNMRLSDISLISLSIIFILICILCPFIQYKNLKRYNKSFKKYKIKD